MFDYYQLLEEIHHVGDEIETRGLKTKELINVQLVVNNYNFFATPIYRPYEEMSKYLFAELSWYLSGERNIKNILPYSKFWGQIRNPDNTANSNYGDLVFYRKNSHGLTSYEWAKNALLEDKLTRKAIVLYNERELFYPNNNDLICNQYQHFLIRNNKLICIVGLRSSDAIYGLTFNIPWWSIVQQQLLFDIKEKYPEVELGSIYANISSSHIYENKWNLVENILNSSHELYFLRLLRGIKIGNDFNFWKNNLINHIAVEKVEN